MIIDGQNINEPNIGHKIQIVSILILGVCEVMFCIIIASEFIIPIMDNQLWLGAGMIYFYVTNIRLTNYTRAIRLIGDNLPSYRFTNVKR